MAKRGAVLGRLQREIKGKSKAGILLCIALATAAGILTMFVMMALFAAVLSSFPLPLSVFSLAGLIIGILGAGAAGLACSLLHGERGFFLGILCAAVLFVILLLVALLVWQQQLGSYSFLKLCAMLLAGATGGIIGVNLK